MRNPNDETNPKPEKPAGQPSGLRSFVPGHSFVIRHWDFVILQKLLASAAMKFIGCLRFCCMGVALAFAGAMCWLAPIGTAFEFGGDEGYELMKGFLCSQGYALYGQIWNDQPPFHTALLTGLFTVFGPSVLAARMLTVLFASVLLGSFYELVRRQSGHLAALLAVALLIASPHFLQLSVSAMIELPAMALGVAAALALVHAIETMQRRWLLVSGMIMGCALQTKLTAALFFPALIAAWLLRDCQKKITAAPLIRSSRREEAEFGFGISNFRFSRSPLASAATKLVKFLRRRVFSSSACLVWLACVVATIWIIRFFYPGENSEALLRSHFSAETKAALAAETGYRFTPVLLWRDYEGLIGAAAGMVVILWRKRSELLFPVVLFGSALLIHQFHRPFWWYYHLHFAIPMAWLSAIAFKELLELLLRWQWPELKRRPLKPALLLLVWSSLTSLLVAGAFDKIQVGLESISHREAIQNNATVQGLLVYRDRTRWVYADRAIYAFHAGLPTPPELAVIPSKRTWSGQISTEFLLDRLEHYQPELILLTSSARWAEELSDFLEREYVAVAVAGSRLYVSKKMEGNYGRKETLEN